MKCLLCGNAIPEKEDGSVMNFMVYIPIEEGKDEEVSVCGRCYLLSSIHDRLKEK